MVKTCRVQPLSGKNYHRWKKDMILYLKSAKLYDVVVQGIPEDPDERWKDKDNAALVDIHNACELD